MYRFKMDNKNNNSFPLLGIFILGIAAGSLLSAFVPGYTERVRKLREKRKKWMSDIDIERSTQELKDMWNRFTDDEKRNYQRVKNRIMDKLTDLKWSLGNVDKKQYIKAVQDSIRDIQKELTLPDDETERLQNYWERNYETIRREME